MTVILGLPLMALGQTTEPQQAQGQTNDTQTTAPAKGKKSVQSWAASEGILRPTIRGIPFPVARDHLLRIRGRLLGVRGCGRLHIY